MPAKLTSSPTQARMRSDLGELEPSEEEVAELRILLGRRRDLVLDQNRGP
jgi:hypothetical protein